MLIPPWSRPLALSLTLAVLAAAPGSHAADASPRPAATKADQVQSARPSESQAISAQDVLDYLIPNSPWVNLKTTVDTVKFGDPKKKFKKVGVTWYPALATLKAAHAAGCDLLVSHEPLFWNVQDPPNPKVCNEPPGDARRKFLEQTGMVVVRAHDTWDQWPVMGVRDGWARKLGLTKRIFASKDHNCWGIYEVREQTLKEFATYMAGRIKSLGEDSVQVIGDPKMKIRHPSLGVGYIGPDKDMVAAGADVLIVCFDGAPYWDTRERLAEMGVGVIAVEHGTSEMPGIEGLTQVLAEKFPAVRFQYFAEHPRTWTVKAR